MICTKGRFHPDNHPFRGKITIFVNELCVSSCDAFVYEIKDELADKVKIIGIPQSADTAYARVALDIYGSPNNLGEYIKLRSIYAEVPEDVLFSQTISIARSVTEDGEMVSGVSEPLDQFVPYSFEERYNYQNKLLKIALTQ
ncbi:MAG: hypothetical protein R3B45_01150 [Bdellovibrionota bacterium]